MKHTSIIRRICILIFNILLYVAPVFSQIAGMDFYKNLHLLPYIDFNTKVQYLSSYDPTGGNDDGFNGTYSALYIDDNGEHVLFDQKGPGCVYNLFFTGDIDANLKFYFDGEKDPRFNGCIESYFQGNWEPFVYPLVYHLYQSTGGYSAAVPIEFEKHLKITTDERINFYNIYSQTYKEGTIVSFNDKKDLQYIHTLFKQCGYDPSNAKADTVIAQIIDLDGMELNHSVDLLSLQEEGTVQYIKFNPLFEPDMFELNHIYLQVTYDGKDTPAIYAPVGPFFGSGLGEAAVNSLFVGMSPSGTYYCYLPMPFRKGIKIELINQKYNMINYPKTVEEYYVEIGVSRAPLFDRCDMTIGNLGVKYNSNYPIVDDQNYEIFSYKGKGAVIGQVVTIEPVQADIKQWWEGDLFIYIDDETEPTIHGTGHEEDLSMGGWSSRWMLNPFSLPLFGLPKSTNLRMIEGQMNGSCTTYRFWPGKLPFKKSIHMSVEHGTNNTLPANYSSLVWYYFIP